MKTYALKFEAGMPQNILDVETRFYDHFDGLIAESFGRLIVTVYVEGHENGAMAAKYAALEIEKKLRVAVVRVDRDLVDAAEIARRIGRSRESVSQLIHGERRKGSPFPTPIGAPNGKRIWEWSVVNEWLRDNVPNSGDPEYGLTRDEMTIVDSWLLRWGCLSREQHIGLEFYDITAPMNAGRPHVRSTHTGGSWVRSWNVSERVIRKPSVSIASD
ncbi:hypothetical protein OTC26_013225 [Streptomyces tirandamycinicus]|uniref:hypothetical protein n=1 Tax=Streptomyces tirandamycinicus TaxID=2174846 RepID=UPI00226D71E4|nr:hypothetical protein [Streptomyces tirandamycinicus]MCY0981420.1 hypothetical protein [Streptomyces tirandamycinicus]